MHGHSPYDLSTLQAPTGQETLARGTFPYFPTSLKCIEGLVASSNVLLHSTATSVGVTSIRLKAKSNDSHVVGLLAFISTKLIHST